MYHCFHGCLVHPLLLCQNYVSARLDDWYLVPIYAQIRSVKVEGIGIDDA